MLSTRYSKVSSHIILLVILLSSLNYGNLMATTDPIGITPVLRSQALISPPTLLTPVYGAIIADDTPYLEWSEIPNAEIYEVQVDSDLFFSSPNDFTATTFHNFIDCSSLDDDSYFWRVRAQDVYNRWTDWSNKWVFTIDTFAPKSPTLLSPKNGFITDDDEITFYWNPVADGIYYQIQVDEDSSFSNPLHSCTITDTSIDYLCFNQDNTYYWRVRARDDAGHWGAWSAIWDFEVDTIPPLPPDYISPSTDSFITDASPLITWDTVTDVIYYHLEIDLFPTFFSPVVDVYTTTNFYQCNNLPEGDYYWRIQTQDAVPLTGGWGPTWHFIIDTLPPDTPALVSPNDNALINDFHPRLEWTAVSNIERYQIQIATNSSFSNLLLNITSGLNPYYDVSITLPESVPIFWRVRAIDEAVNIGNWGEIWQFIVDVQAPNTPILLSPSNGSNFNNPNPTLRWDVIPTATTYQIMIDDEETFVTPIITTTSSNTLYSCNSLSDGSYYWRVKAIDAATNPSSWSEIWSFEIDTTPPGNLTLYYPYNNTIDNDNSPFLNWSVIIDASEYLLQLSDMSNFSDLIINTTVIDSNYTCPTLSDDGYFWRVAAIDEASNLGEWSIPYYFIIDTIAPEISSIIVTPSSPTDLEIINISCNVWDVNGLSKVQLYYRINGGNWLLVDMYYLSSNIYTISIGSFEYSNYIELYINSSDISSHANFAVENNSGSYYSFEVVSWDKTGPEITSISNTPEIPTDVDSVTVSCYVSDGTGISFVTLYYRLNESEWLAVNMSLISGYHYEITLESFSFGDFIEYYIVAIDNSPNYNPTTDNNSSSYYSFNVTISDTTGPTIIDLEYIPLAPQETNTVDIFCRVSDENNISSVLIFYRVNNGTWINITMEPNGAGTSYSVTIGPFLYADFIDFYILATDNYFRQNTAINDNYGDYYQFTVLSSDNYSPSFHYLHTTPEIPTDSDEVTFACIIFDTNNISYATLHYRLNSGNWINLTMNETPESFEVTLGPFVYGDFIEYYVSAVDDSPNHNLGISNDNEPPYSFTICSSDTTPPTISEVTHTIDTMGDSTTAIITCNVTDENSILEVRLYYRINEGTWSLISISNSSINSYSMTIEDLELDNTVTYYIEATDNSPNHNNATNDNEGSYYSFTISTTETTIIPFLSIFSSILFLGLKKKKQLS